ncbi:MAG: NYN domain-containing protein [Aquabacterium sp.]
MASPSDHISMALFCDFENVALGVRDANYDKFDIKRVLERLLLKGSIVVKKAYCDWDRYKTFKSPMHEANFELIEIPHVRQSGKNSADIRLVVDALDLCYTKSHVNTFVIISGDSDFSPLVSKLRENAKYVIGVGVKQSTSDLLIANCDEFIFYDDLVRESQRNSARRDNRDNNAPRRSPEEEQRRRAEMDTRRTKAIEMAVETYEALVTDRDVGGKIWASVLKEAIKRRNPGFNENYYGFRTFGNLLEEAQNRGLLEFGRDEKSSAFVTRGTGVTQSVRTEGQTDLEASAQGAIAIGSAIEPDLADTQAAPSSSALADDTETAPASQVEAGHGESASRPRRTRGGRGRSKTAMTEGAGPAVHADGLATAAPATAPVDAPPREPLTKSERSEITAEAAIAGTSETASTPAAKKASKPRRRPAAKKASRPSTKRSAGTDSAG